MSPRGIFPATQRVHSGALDQGPSAGKQSQSLRDASVRIRHTEVHRQATCRAGDVAVDVQNAAKF